LNSARRRPYRHNREKMKGMCMRCDMMKSDQSGQQSDQSEHSHH
jgi:hypothetical protein